MIDQDALYKTFSSGWIARSTNKVPGPLALENAYREWMRQNMSLLERRGGKLQPVQTKKERKMYLAVEMTNNPKADPNGNYAGFKVLGGDGSEDMLRQAIANELGQEPGKVYGIFEIVGLMTAEVKTEIHTDYRNMR